MGIATCNPLLCTGDEFASRYVVDSLIATGGTCEVYRVVDREVARAVALKLLLPRWNAHPIMISRLKREFDIARRIEHESVARVFDFGRFSGQHYLTMEFAAGGDLGQNLSNNGPPPSDRAMRIAKQVCAGLVATHDRAVIHRDLKPANILLDVAGHAKISDFGYAYVIGEPIGPDARIGTPAYMSPEQLAARMVGEQSDIYSLGLLLYEVFTGRPYFETNELQAIRRQHEKNVPPAFSIAPQRPPNHIERLIVSCLQHAPECRPKTMREVAELLN